MADGKYGLFIPCLNYGYGLNNCIKYNRSSLTLGPCKVSVSCILENQYVPSLYCSPSHGNPHNSTTPRCGCAHDICSPKALIHHNLSFLFNLNLFSISLSQTLQIFVKISTIMADKMDRGLDEIIADTVSSHFLTWLLLFYAIYARALFSS